MSTPVQSAQAATLSLAHSPDSDDAFMFYALATGKVRLPGVRFEHTLCDIETLNNCAHREVYDVTAVSFYGYAFVADKYVLLDCGASFGEGYGPIIVSSHPLKKNDLAGRRIAIPGTRTTSYLALKLFEPNVETVTMPFDKILDARRRVAQLQIAAPAQFVGDIGRDVARPSFRGVEADDADRV